MDPDKTTHAPNFLRGGSGWKRRRQNHFFFGGPIYDQRSKPPLFQTGTGTGSKWQTDGLNIRAKKQDGAEHHPARFLLLSRNGSNTGGGSACNHHNQEYIEKNAKED